MNEYDSNRIFDLAKKINYQKTENIGEADCYVLNTCHIREKATEKVYHDVGRVKKEFKNKKKPIVVVTGCVAQAEGEVLLKKEKYIDAVIGPQSYHKFNNTLIKLEKNSEKINFTEFDVDDKFDNLNIIKNSNSNISSLITIQEGCDKFCKFCVVPYTRGPEHSRSIKEILEECRVVVGNGAREITLLGQNVNAYNFEGKKLSNLIYEISKINELKRIRYTTSHPVDFSQDLIDIYNQTEKLMPLIHLPVQSGSNKILKAMNRKHNIKQYLKIFEKLKQINPHIEFSSDFIIGYPGENDQDFKETIDLIKKINFINSYSFIFSPRPGTVAENLKIIDKEISIKRLEIIQKLLSENQIKTNKSLKNHIVDVLVENLTEDKTKAFGRSEHMTPVFFNGKQEDIGKIVKVKINESNRNSLFGELINISKKKVA